MSLTTQDLVKGIDITGLSTVTGSELTQLVDVARVAEDKGLIIETQDSAVGTPIVPDPDDEIDGITPTWWKRYLWKRLPHADDTDRSTKLYFWNEDNDSVATYLKWTNVLDENATAAIEALDLRVTALESLTEATTTRVDNLETDVTELTERVTTNESNITTNNTSITQLQSDLQQVFLTGEIKMVGFPITYATDTDDGWLKCDGTEVSREIFATLFAKIGTRFGTPSSELLFKVPDFRGVFPVGVGTVSGVGRSSDVVDAPTVGRTGGHKEVTLTADQSGSPAHNHPIFFAANTSGSGSSNNTGSYTDGVSTDTKITTELSTPQNAASAHPIIPPYLGVNFIIKT